MNTYNSWWSGLFW